MTRTYNREPVIWPERNINRRSNGLNRTEIRNRLLLCLQWLFIVLYGLSLAHAAVELNLVPFTWSWTILLAIYPPFVILGFCDTSCRERKNAGGTTTRRTGWPFRIALIWVCIPPLAGFCFLVGMGLASQLQMEMESGCVISIGLFIAFIWYAIDMNRLLNH